MQEMQVRSLGQEDPLEKGMTTHAGILAWETPWTEEPGGLQSMGPQTQTWVSNLFIVQLLSSFQLFATPWAAACQALWSFTVSLSLLKLISIEWVMPSNHLIPYCVLLLLPSIFSSIRVLYNDIVFTSGGQSIGASVSASALPMNIQDWFPLGLTGLIPLKSKRLSRVFFSTTVQKHQFSSTTKQQKI